MTLKGNLKLHTFERISFHAHNCFLFWSIIVLESDSGNLKELKFEYYSFFFKQFRTPYKYLRCVQDLCQVVTFTKH
jgi:hypothetical protein